MHFRSFIDRIDLNHGKREMYMKMFGRRRSDLVYSHNQNGKLTCREAYKGSGKGKDAAITYEGAAGSGTLLAFPKPARDPAPGSQSLERLVGKLGEARESAAKSSQVMTTCMAVIN